MSADRPRSSWRDRHLLLLGLLPATTTALVYLPQLLNRAGESEDWSGARSLGWLLLLLLGAPLVACLLNRRLRVPSSAARWLLVGLPQLLLLVALVRLDVWFDVRTGYLPPGSSEQAMAYGLSGLASLLGGALLVLLTEAGAHLGGPRSTVATPGR